ncbi:MAG: hypothetical protein JRJ77_15495, partial [Deltaproteobacteria bacterium]|nr:hypothetical protein [Deltaproteobacteria bacterium]
QQLFPTQLFEEHLSSRLADLLNLSIKDIHKQYCSTLGFPVPTFVRSVSQAIRELCSKGQIGIRHPRGNFCQENPSLTETELFDAKVGEPFETTHRPPILTPTGEGVEISSPISGEETTIITPPTAIPEKREEIAIPPQAGPGELRQTIAARLQEFPDPKITQIRTTIFLEKSTGDLTSLPASIRGNLSGQGSLTAEITITKSGEFSKGEVEQIIEGEERFAIVIFDGLSLREIPVLLNLAQTSGFIVQEVGASYSALPTETTDFIEHRLKFGNISPSQLPKRKGLREKGIADYYYDNPNQQHLLDRDSKGLLLWSAFPDNTYSDSGARFPQHFEQISQLLETAWLNTVQQIPRGRKILLTSDHGYVYLGSGLSFPRSNTELRPLSEYLGGERYRRLSDEGKQPPDHPDLVLFPSRKVAVLRGRIQTHPPGKAASRLYKHGGLSVMEILTPWILLVRD